MTEYVYVSTSNNLFTHNKNYKTNITGRIYSKKEIHKINNFPAIFSN